MSMTLWPSRQDLRREVALQSAKEILSERLWLPIYEEGGMDALVKAGEIAPLPPPPSNRVNPGSPVR